MPFGELLEQHRVGLTLVTLHRERLTSARVSGVIRQFSKRLILIEVLGDSTGISLIRREDLTRIDTGTAALRRTLHARGSIARSHPITREVDLTEWRSAIASAQVIAPSMVLHRDGIGDPVTLASRSIQLLKHLVVGAHPDPTASEEGEIALAFEHLTRLDLAN